VRRAWPVSRSHTLGVLSLNVSLRLYRSRASAFRRPVVCQNFSPPWNQ
jgi:hypothetical protein